MCWPVFLGQHFGGIVRVRGLMPEWLGLQIDNPSGTAMPEFLLPS